MASVDFNQVVEQVRALTPSQQWQLYIMLDTWLTFPPDLTDAEFARELARRGEISIPPPITDFTPYQNRQLVEVKGKPVSQTIIEERR
jgi:hypothetical protein